MIAWLALVLGLLNLAVWVVLAVVGRRLYVQLAPTLAMFGLGAGSVAVPAGTEPTTAAEASSPAGDPPGYVRPDHYDA